MLTKIREAMQKRRAGGESGFTLIELLVVMIIIGILAAIAIPIFQNQQKGARDSSTTSDVRNVATNVQSALVRYPDAAYFVVVDDTVTAAPATIPTAATTDTDGDGLMNVFVGDSSSSAEKYEVSVSKGTELLLTAGTNGGDFKVDAFNTSGKSYKASTSTLKYDSALGGLQN